MLKILNASGPSPTDAGPAELLLACHGRIRWFTALAARLASAEPASEASVADAALRVHRYHAVALPLHQADEELSIARQLVARYTWDDLAHVLLCSNEFIYID